jgi:transposase-like protein
MKTIGSFDIKLIEQATFMYLRALSFSSVVLIFRSWFDQEVFTKAILLNHIEQLADSLPSHQEVTEWLKPNRSGYYALDGTWMKLAGKEFVLLILFDVETMDVVSWIVSEEENQASYTCLLQGAYSEICSVKGFFCDGELGLLKSLKTLFPGVPVQLCVFHKYSRAGQIIPFVHVRNERDREIKKRVESVLFADTKQSAIDSLIDLERYAREHQEYPKLKQILGVLKRNFDLLLTHFDYPEMSPYNNVLEGFNYLIKRKTNLMKGFKKERNVRRWIKLILLDWRFHTLSESKFIRKRKYSPLQLSGCDMPKIHNWMTFVREKYGKKST